MKRAQLDVQILVLVTLALVAFGLVMVYSATSASATISNSDPNSYLKRQGIYAAIGLVLLFVFSRINFRSLKKLAPMLVVGSLVLCVAVLVLGTAVNGARRWISFGPIVFQPSELAKLALAVWAAWFLSRRGAPQTLKQLARPIGLLVGDLLRSPSGRARPRDRDRACPHAHRDARSWRARPAGRSSPPERS